MDSEFKIIFRLNLARHCFRTDRVTQQILDFLIFRFKTDAMADYFVRKIEQFEINKCTLNATILEKKNF